MLSISSRTAVTISAWVAAFAMTATTRAADSELRDDRARIGELAAQVAHGEWRERQQALRALRQEHGPYAVNGLLRFMGSRADAEAREQAVFAMRRLEGESVLAMVAAMESDDAMTRRNLCLVLEAAGDRRAAAALAEAAQHDPDAIVRRMAAQAIERLNLRVEGDAAAQWATQAADMVGASCNDPCAVFFWNGREVAHRPANRAIYGPAYALLFAEQALELEPGNTDAQKAYLLSAKALYDAIALLGPIPDWQEMPAPAGDAESATDDASMDDESMDEDMGDEEDMEEDGGDAGPGGPFEPVPAPQEGGEDGEMGERLRELGYGGAGEATEETELEEIELSDEAKEAWLALAPRLRELVLLAGGGGSRPQGADEREADDSLEGAEQLLTSPDKRYRYRAALTLAQPGASAAVVGTLADALAENAVRQILVIEPDTNRANELAAMVGGRGRDVVVATTAVTGLIRAKEAPKDVILLSTMVEDLDPALVIQNLQRDARTKDAAIVVVAKESEAEVVREALGSSVAAVLPAPVSKGMLEPAMGAAFDRAALNDERMSAEDFARRAAAALAALDADSLRPATAALVRAVGREDAVTVPALNALAKIGAPEAEEVARTTFADTAASRDARIAAGRALWGVLEENEAHPATLSVLEQTLRSGDDPALRALAAHALGSAKGLSPDVRGRLLLDLNVAY